MAETSKEKKRIKCEEDDDLISGLPDCLIQHILSFLPSIKDAIGTAILSKRWLNQWTSVPVLIFRSRNGMSIQNFPNFIDNALNLYNCSRINKFEIDSYHFSLDELRLKFPSWVRFATSRGVKELILNCDPYVEFDDQFYDPAAAAVEVFDNSDKYEPPQMPQFLFNNAFLVKFKTHCCLFRPEKGNVNWSSLKALYIGYSYLTNEGIQNVLSGSPVIEYLELQYCSAGFQRMDEITKISIASKSLKTFRMRNSVSFAFEISCPNLEKLELGGRMRVTSLKFRDLPASVSVTLDFKIGKNDCSAAKLKLVEEFLLQVQHVEELKIGPCILKILSFAAVGAKSSLLLNCKCLIVYDPFSVVRQPGLPISYLRFSSLEKLVIHQCPEHQFYHEEFMKKERIWEVVCLKDWSVFDNLVSHLKTIEIVGLTYGPDCDRSNDVLKFVTFLLKNARLLEKMVLLEYSEQEMDLAHEVCKKLSCIQKSSPHAIVKVARLKWHDSDYDWDKIVC